MGQGRVNGKYFQVMAGLVNSKSSEKADTIFFPLIFYYSS